MVQWLSPEREQIVVLTTDVTADPGDSYIVNLVVWKNVRKRADSCNNFGSSS